MTDSSPVACHDCDWMQELPALPAGGLARCCRCDATLARARTDPVNRTLALALAGVVLFLVSNTFPFLSFRMQGLETETTLATGVVDLHRQGMSALAAVVLGTAILAPAVHLAALLYLSLPLRMGRVPAGLSGVLRVVQRARSWNMMEVFLLGILVSVVKLAGMATVVPGLALYAFGALIFVMAAANASFDPRTVWRRADELS